MRIYLIVVGLLCCLVLPAFAQEAPEATSKRVKELEKANLVLQEDLARTQLALDDVRSALKKSQKSLDEEIASRKALATQLDQEIASRKALMEKLDQVQQQLVSQTTASQNNDAAINAKLDALTKALADQSDKFNQDMAAMRDGYNKQLATMTDALNKERADRIAAENDAGKARAKLAKDGKQTRTIMTVLGVLLGGAVLTK